MEKSQTSVRKAEKVDIPEILELYKKGLKEIGEDYLESLLVQKIVSSFHLAPCFLLVDSNEIIGMAGFTLVTSSHNGKQVMADYMFYVEPGHRGLRTLGLLVEAAKEFSNTHRLILRVEFISQGDEQLKRRLLRMHGFEVAAIIGVFNG